MKQYLLLVLTALVFAGCAGKRPEAKVADFYVITVTPDTVLNTDVVRSERPVNEFDCGAKNYLVAVAVIDDFDVDHNVSFSWIDYDNATYDQSLRGSPEVRYRHLDGKEGRNKFNRNVVWQKLNHSDLPIYRQHGVWRCRLNIDQKPVKTIDFTLRRE